MMHVCLDVCLCVICVHDALGEFELSGDILVSLCV